MGEAFEVCKKPLFLVTDSEVTNLKVPSAKFAAQTALLPISMNTSPLTPRLKN